MIYPAVMALPRPDRAIDRAITMKGQAGVPSSATKTGA